MKQMKRKNSRMPLTVSIVLTGAILTLIGYINRRGSYRDYDQNVLKHPLFTIVFQGLHDGVKPGDEAKSVVEARQQEQIRQQEEAARKKAEEEAKAAAEAARKAEPVTEFPEGVNSPVVQAVSYGNEDRNYLAPEGTTWPLQQDGIFRPIQDEFYYLQSVDDSYFTDAVFIGDSRTNGLAAYSDLAGIGTFLAEDGLSVYKVFDAPLLYYAAAGSSPDPSKATVQEVLSGHSFGKVYLCLGINELGTGTTVDFQNEYKQVVEQLRTLQPDAIIYLQGIMHVSKAVASTDPVINNTNIVEKNTAVSALANGRDIFYIDMNSSVCDEDGNVLPELTGDGVHLKASAYAKWYEFLKDNAIVRDETDREAAGESGTGSPGQ